MKRKLTPEQEAQHRKNEEFSELARANMQRLIDEYEARQHRRAEKLARRRRFFFFRRAA